MKTEKEIRDALYTLRKYINVHLPLYEQGKVNIGQAHFDMMWLKSYIEETLGMLDTPLQLHAEIRDALDKTKDQN